MRFRPHTFTAVLLALVLMPGVSGQERGGVRDMGFIRSVNPWLSSENAAGLSTLPVGRISVAEARFGKQDGGLIGNDGSPDSFNAEAQTESFIRISDRMSFYGRLSYSYFKGKEMGGPVLMDPSYNPINFYESSDTTLGIKNRELYRLIGGISYALNDRWSLGAKIDYTGGDQAKQKDPRFLNVWLDMNLSAGFRWTPSERLSIGADLRYKRTVEQIEANQYGTTDKQYFTFIDLGGYYGSRELFEGRFGYVAVGDTRPMFNSLYGASLQIETGKRIRIFNEITYLRRAGYFGEKSSTTVTFTEHSGNILKYRGVLLIGNGEKDMHRIGLDLSYEGLVNGENIYRMNTNVGENTTVEYFGQNEVLDRTDINAALSYTGYRGIIDFRPEWEYGAGAGFSSRTSLTTIYPFYRESRISTMDFSAYGARNIRKDGRNIFTVRLEAGFAAGFGNPASDGMFTGSTSVAPRSADIYMNRDFEYRTMSRIKGLFTFRYTRLFKENIAAYIEVGDGYTNLLGGPPTALCGTFRNTFHITAGCTF